MAHPAVGTSRLVGCPRMRVDQQLPNATRSAPTQNQALEPTPGAGSSSAIARGSRRWAIVRVLLGLAQITGATVALQLLLQSGFGRWSFGALMMTGACTTASLLLFGNRSRVGPREATGAASGQDKKPLDGSG